MQHTENAPVFWFSDSPGLNLVCTRRWGWKVTVCTCETGALGPQEPTCWGGEARDWLSFMLARENLPRTGLSLTGSWNIPPAPEQTVSVSIVSSLVSQHQQGLGTASTGDLGPSPRRFLP